METAYELILLHQSWEAVSKRIPPNENAGIHPELRQEIEMKKFFCITTN